MPPTQDFQTTFKLNLTCIFLSARTRYIMSNPDEIPCTIWSSDGFKSRIYESVITYLHSHYKIITKVPKTFKIPRSRIRELVDNPKDSGLNSSFKSEPQLRFHNCRLIQGCQKRMILIVLDQVAIHGFKLRPDFIDEQFLHHCILTDQNLLIYLRY